MWPHPPPLYIHSCLQSLFFFFFTKWWFIWWLMQRKFCLFLRLFPWLSALFTHFRNSIILNEKTEAKTLVLNPQLIHDLNQIKKVRSTQVTAAYSCLSMFVFVNDVFPSHPFFHPSILVLLLSLFEIYSNTRGLIGVFVVLDQVGDRGYHSSSFGLRSIIRGGNL